MTPYVLYFIIFCILGFAILAVTLFISYTVIPRLWGDAPYVGSKREKVEKMLRLAKLVSTDRVVDLGSGDGRLVFAAAKQGVAEAVGYEIHPVLVWRSRLLAKLLRLPNATFRSQSFWDISLREFNVVLVYQLPRVMIRLAKKFSDELPPGAKIISNSFELPGWEPILEEPGVRVYQKKS